MKAHFRYFAVALAFAFLAANKCVAGLFTPGNLVVVRTTSDGSASSFLSAHATYLDEVTLTGVPVQTLSLPTSPNGSNRRLTITRSRTAGYLSRSTDGRYLLLGGYDAPVDTPNVQFTSSSAVNRVVGRIDGNGVIDTTTALTDAYDGDLFRSVASNNGTNLWLTGLYGGANGSSGGVRHATFGGTTSNRLANEFEVPLVARIFNGQLYSSANVPTTLDGVNTVGFGLPTTGGNFISNVVDTGTSFSPESPWEFFFATPDLLYVCIGSNDLSLGGLWRWSRTDGIWSHDYTIAMPQQHGGCSSLTGTYDAASNTTRLYAVTSRQLNNSLLSIMDTGANSGFSVLASAGQFRTFRGIAFAPIPEPSTLTLLIIGAAGLLCRRH